VQLAPDGCVRTTQEHDLPHVRRLLSDAFSAPCSQSFLLPGALWWKYFETREDWPGPRSFVLTEKDAILAHIAFWPFTLLLPAAPIQAVQAIDWTGSRKVPCAGSFLRRCTSSVAPVQVGIGGTLLARQAREKSGFCHWKTLRQWTLVCRPGSRFLGEIRGQPVRATGRLLRELRVGPRGRPKEQSCACAPAHRFGDELRPILPVSVPGWVRRSQSSVSLNYLLSCPQIRCQGFHLSRDGQLWGYFILARTSPWARIVTLHVHDARSGGLETAYLAAVAAAMEDPQVWGVTTHVSCAMRETALARVGFRRGITIPAVLLDPHSLIDPRLEVDLQMSESDAFTLD